MELDDAVPKAVERKEITRPFPAPFANGELMSYAEVRRSLRHARSLLRGVDKTSAEDRPALIGKMKHWIATALIIVEELATKATVPPTVKLLRLHMETAVDDVERLLADAQNSTGLLLIGRLQSSIGAGWGALDELEQEHRP